MPRSDRPRASRLLAGVAAVGAVLAVAGCASGVASTVSRPTPADVAVGPSVAAGALPRAEQSFTSAAAPSTSALPPLPPTPGPLRPSTTAAPVRVQIPAIGVDSSLERLGLLPDRSLASPSTWGVAGWYSGGVVPGDPGPAIVAGHVDSYLGPAVFYDLGKLRRGDRVTVTRADGSVVTFVVDSTAQYPKARFPTDAVYGPTPTPELRLITCTGIFDRQARSYLDNLVVTAVLAS
jgi:sortase (surface protein transpeptidase)